MAITVITEPTDLMPIHSPMMYLLSSTLSTEKNFKIEFKVTVNAEVRNVKVSPRPDGRVEFNVASHLRDYLDLSEFNPTKVLTGNSDVAPHAIYKVDFTEEYIDASGDLITGTLVAGVNATGTNIVLNRSELINYSADKWENITSAIAPVSDVLLNSKPNSSYYKDDVIWVHTAGHSFDPPVRFRTFEYDGSGNLLVTGSSPTVLGNDICKYYKFDLSTQSFNANTKSIGILFENDNFEPVTKVNRYKLKDVECSSFDKYRFIYLDKLGSYNTISLNHASNEEVSIKRENFSSRLDSLTDIDSSRGLQTYFTSANETYTLNTGNLNADDMAKFEDLLLSTRVMLDVRSHPDSKFDGMEYVPFMINTKSMKRYKSENQQIAQYTIEGELGYKLNVRTR